MQYFCGKHRLSSRLCKIIQPAVDRFDSYVEPFVGGCSVLSKIKCTERAAGDANAALIAMWAAASDGWVAPTALNEAEYRALRLADNVADPATAFAGIGLSFAGKWFGGYARDSRGDDYCGAASRSIDKIGKLVSDVKWFAGDYRSMPLPDRCVIYCDPPYAGTTQYAGAPDKFDWSVFWDWCRERAKYGNHVFISEYKAPDDATCVAEFPTRLEIRNADNEREHRVERLFEYRPK